jgi:DNA-binding CsgD family transcriptional regulator
MSYPENPWSLSDGQVKVLDSVIEHKTLKGACMALGITIHTGSEQASRAQKKMQAANRLDALLIWDRYRRAE